MHYIREVNIKKFYRDNRLQVSKEFLTNLDSIVHEILLSTTKVWNGRGKRVNSSLLPEKAKAFLK